MSLREYRRKRDFQKSVEPKGGETTASLGRRFVVQMHAASRLHYDFRLEVDGVLKSWAVPKGPSLDPSVKSLAVQVEDHPLAYANFEGIIPKGQYGGGTVMVWDQGEWEPLQDFKPGFRKGSLKFRLHGTKLKGDWALVRMKDRGDAGDKQNWLLIKHKDAEARATDKYDVTEHAAKSVLTGRTLEAIAQDADRVWPWSPKKTKPRARRSVSRKTSAVSPVETRLNELGAKQSKLPITFIPELATSTETVPEGDDWLHEVKFDGYRLLCFVDGKDVRLVTRRGNDWTDRFPFIVEAVRKLRLGQCLLDGELVAVDSLGRSHFQKLQNALRDGNGEGLIYYIFDAPFLSGYDLRTARLIDRKSLLADVLSTKLPDNQGILRYSEHIQGNGAEVLQQCCGHGLEGIVSKRADSPYESRRTRSWLKAKCHCRQEFVIGGFTAPQGARSHFGALLVGYREGNQWVYCGRVGTGFDKATLRNLNRRLRPLKRTNTPFVNSPRGAAVRGVTWVEPQLVAEVRFSQWTDDGVLRHPAYLGLREDKAAVDVVREQSCQAAGEPAMRAPRQKSKSKNATTTIAGVALSNPDRVVYPENGITKARLAEYYVAVADGILPHIIDRPLTLLRCPRGRAAKCFVQRHWTEAMPEAVGSVDVGQEKDEEPYVVIRDLRGLISLLQMNVLELHPWGARVDRIERPDVLVFDLDPGPGVKWEMMQECTVELREFLHDAGLESFPRTSGGAGLNVVSPISRRSTWDDAGDFAHQVALRVVERWPKKYVANMRKELRKGKIFIDYVRNRRSATAIASYSTRAREGAPVATPFDWEELPAIKSASQFNVENVVERLTSTRTAAWQDYFTIRQSITAAAWKQVRKS